ncbi:MAG: universal stress protein [Candidatus Obscuribacterales bacterium]|nr:universal stress protein [Candidatus Obscuribacterales bacterium]
MAKKSLLLALSGSQQSLQAAQLCWKLAELTNSRVTAQHVIDTFAISQLLGHELPGFIGTAPYLEIRADLFEKMKAVGQELVKVYDERAAFHSFESSSVIDSGDPVQEICRRAKEHDLVVIGHQTIDNDHLSNVRHQFIRNSVAAGLAHECPRPLLIVRELAGLCKKVKLVMSAEHINQLLIDDCIQTANLLGAKVEIICLAADNHEEPAKMLIKDLQKSNPLLNNVKIRVHNLCNATHIKEALAWDKDGEHAVNNRELLVIPTRQIVGKRITVFGSSPSDFIKHAGFSTILLWPEEHSQPIFKQAIIGMSAYSK